MKFKKIEKPIYTSDPYYDIFDGGYIDPNELLDDQEQINEVQRAIKVIKSFLNTAESKGILQVE